MRQLRIEKSITHGKGSGELLARYLNEVDRTPLLNVNREVLLAQRIKRGDKSALDELVTANLRFVVTVSKQYQNQGLELPDLINEGNIGLIKAANRFDETRGFKFISYAVWWIRESILQALAEESRIVRVPSNVDKDIKLVKKTANKLEGQLQRDPLPDEIAEFLEIPEKDVKVAKEMGKYPISMDSLVGDTDDTFFVDTLVIEQQKPEEGIDINDFIQNLENRVCRLNENESYVIFHTYGICGRSIKSTWSIANDLKKSIPQIEKLRGSGLKKLRKNKSLYSEYKSLICA